MGPFLLSASLCLGSSCDRFGQGRHLHFPLETAVSWWREGQARTCSMHLSCHSRMGPHEHSRNYQLSPRSDKYSTHLEPGDPSRRTRPCCPGCWHVQLQDLQPAAGWDNLPPDCLLLGQRHKARECWVPWHSWEPCCCQAAPEAPDLHPSCLGMQQRERLGYFKQVMSVLPSLSLPILPEALITVAGWICQTKRANGLIDMIWQLICNLIILSSRTHYSLFITLLSSQVCFSRALRTT